MDDNVLEPWNQSVRWNPQILKHQSLPPRDKPYHVPERFGLAGILALMTVMSLVFVILRWIKAPGFLFVVLPLLVLIICLAQMRWGDVPRASSIVAGAILLPLGVAIGALVEQTLADSLYVVLFSPCLAIVGALLGYLTGAVVAGVFLVLDRWEDRDRPRERSLPLEAEILDD